MNRKWNALPNPCVLPLVEDVRMAFRIHRFLDLDRVRYNYQAFFFPWWGREGRVGEGPGGKGQVGSWSSGRGKLTKKETDSNIKITVPLIRKNGW